MKPGIFFVWLLLFACPCTAFGQEFESIIQDMVDERAKISSYHMTATAEIEGEPETVKLSDGSTFVRKKILVGFTLELIVDPESKRRLIARKNQFLVKATNTKEYSPWFVAVETLEHKISYSDQSGGGHGRVTKPDVDISMPAHFDPLALGLMFPGEFERGDPLGTIVQNYAEWEKGFVGTEIEDEKIRYEGKIFENKQAFYMIKDPLKGHWPIEMAKGDPQPFKQTLVIDKIKGQWLPKESSFVDSGKTTKLKFEWHVVNRSIDDALFELADVEEKYGFTVTKKKKR